MSSEMKPSAEAVEAEASLGNCTCVPQYPDGDRKYDCPGCTYSQYAYSPDLALAIQRAVDVAITKRLTAAESSLAEARARVAELEQRAAVGCATCAARNRSPSDLEASYELTVPSLTCDECGKPTGITIGGLCAACYRIATPHLSSGEQP